MIFWAHRKSLDHFSSSVLSSRLNSIDVAVLGDLFPMVLAFPITWGFLLQLGFTSKLIGCVHSTMPQLLCTTIQVVDSQLQLRLLHLQQWPSLASHSAKPYFSLHDPFIPSKIVLYWVILIHYKVHVMQHKLQPCYLCNITFCAFRTHFPDITLIMLVSS